MFLVVARLASDPDDVSKPVTTNRILKPLLLLSNTRLPDIRRDLILAIFLCFCLERGHIAPLFQHDRSYPPTLLVTVLMQ